MSVNGHKFRATCYHCDVLAFENGTISGENAKSAVRGHPIDRNYIVLLIDNTNRTSCQRSLVIFWARVLEKAIRGQFGGRSLLQNIDC
jgi:hypothetical protein